MNSPINNCNDSDKTFRYNGIVLVPRVTTHSSVLMIIVASKCYAPAALRL